MIITLDVSYFVNCVFGNIAGDQTGNSEKHERLTIGLMRRAEYAAEQLMVYTGQTKDF